MTQTEKTQTEKTMILMTENGSMIQDPCCISYSASGSVHHPDRITVSAIPKGCNQQVVIGSVATKRDAVDAIRRYALALKCGSRDIIYWSDLI